MSELEYLVQQIEAEISNTREIILQESDSLKIPEQPRAYDASTFWLIGGVVAVKTAQVFLAVYFGRKIIKHGKKAVRYISSVPERIKYKILLGSEHYPYDLE